MGMGDAPKAGAILLVEDSGPTRIVIARILEAAGYRVIQAANAGEAVTLIAGERPDLVITDIFMPEGDGFQLMKVLRDRATEVPVIVMSAGGVSFGVDYLDIARQLGAAAILKKPFGNQQLLDAVTQALGKSAPI